MLIVCVLTQFWMNSFKTEFNGVYIRLNESISGINSSDNLGDFANLSVNSDNFFWDNVAFLIRFLNRMLKML